jgi:hypothetical protein
MSEMSPAEIIMDLRRQGIEGREGGCGYCAAVEADDSRTGLHHIWHREGCSFVARVSEARLKRQRVFEPEHFAGRARE